MNKQQVSDIEALEELKKHLSEPRCKVFDYKLVKVLVPFTQWAGICVDWTNTKISTGKVACMFLNKFHRNIIIKSFAEFNKELNKEEPVLIEACNNETGNIEQFFVQKSKDGLCIYAVGEDYKIIDL
jgi:hypothetical protein